MTTLTADRGGQWACSCGNADGTGEGFWSCDEDGEPEPNESPAWLGHYRCNRCLFVFTESDLIREA